MQGGDSPQAGRSWGSDQQEKMFSRVIFDALSLIRKEMKTKLGGKPRLLAQRDENLSV